MASALILLPFLSGCKNDTQKAAEETDLTSEDSTVTTEKTGAQKEVGDLIQVSSPEPGAGISSPLQINGKARGTWFFEGDFPVRLFDAKGKELAVAIAVAQGEWMTEEWVDFEATMEFEPPAKGTGVLVFEKSNPSDMRELDREFRVEVEF